MTYKLIRTASFERDVRLAKKQNRDLDKLAEVLELLRRGVFLRNIATISLKDDLRNFGNFIFNQTGSWYT